MITKLIPQWPDLQKVAESDARMKAASAHSYDRHHGARALPPVGVESPVLMKSDGVNRWERYSTKVGSQVGNRSYLVRNRRHIKALPLGFDAGSVRYSRLATLVGMSEPAPLPTPAQESDPSVMKEGTRQERENNGESQYVITRSGRSSKPPSRLYL